MGNEKDNEDNKEKDFWTSKVSHEAMMVSAPEVSLFESLRKGYESVSKSIIGLFHNKEGNLVTNKEQIWVDKEQSNVIEIDIKESTKEQGEELKIKGSKTENTKVQTYAKSSIKLRN